jgi:hypothetical protein
VDLHDDDDCNFELDDDDDDDEADDCLSSIAEADDDVGWSTRLSIID